jgi:hypothetical protein
MTSAETCTAITLAGARCTKKAINNKYCGIHNKIYVPDETKQEMIPDLLKNIVSDYLDLDEIKSLEGKINNLQINKSRYTKKEYTFKGIKIISYYDADILIKIEKYDNHDNLIRRYTFNGKKGKHSKKFGLQSGWYPNGSKMFERYYDNSGKMTDIHYEWLSDGTLRFEITYFKGEKIKSIKYYNNGLPFVVWSLDAGKTQGYHTYDSTELIYTNIGNLKSITKYDYGRHINSEIIYFKNTNAILSEIKRLNINSDISKEIIEYHISGYVRSYELGYRETMFFKETANINKFEAIRLYNDTN